MTQPTGMGKPATHRMATALSLACILAAGNALADPKADAKRHFDRAVELLHDGQPREAMIEFQRAYDLKPHYLPLYNIGQAYIQLAQPVEAVEYLERSLREGGKTIPAARRTDLENEIRRQKTRIAILDISVEPAGATVRVDDRDLGAAPVSGPVKVGIGTHTVTVVLDGYRPIETRVTVAGEEHKTVQLHLEKLPIAPAPSGPPPGQVLVDCAVPEVEITVEGRPVGKSPLAAAVLVPVGTRVVSFRRPGYAPSEQRVQVPEQGAARVTCKLAALKPLPDSLAAHLTVSPSEDGAEVRLDGMAFPTDGRVPTGLHHIEVLQPGFVTWKSDVRVEAQQQTSIKVVLVPTPAYREQYESKARTRRLLGYALGATGLALGAAAIGVYAWNDRRFKDWQTERDALDQLWAQRPPYPADVGSRQDANDELIRSIQRSDKVVVGLGIAGGALLTTGVVLLVTGDSPSRYENLALVPQSGGGMLGWTGVW